MEEANLIPFPAVDGPPADGPDDVGLSVEALGLMMPMFLWLGEQGVIRAAGQTLQKVTGQGLIGRPFEDVFRVKRPKGAGPADLAAAAGLRIQIDLVDGSQRGLRGVSVPLSGGRGVLLNLSFGIAVAEAVRENDLTDRDFAPTDLAVEMLYLIEAKAAVAKENQALTLRLKEARDLAAAEAMTDTLTGLGNRRAMDRSLSAALSQGAPFALLHIDLDYFKKVNDSYGHAAGDHVLREIAHMLRSQVRGEDLVARIGGDEFVILLSGEWLPPQLEAFADRLLRAAERPIVFEGESCLISLSIGAALSDTSDAERLFDRADTALYISKHAGRGRYTLWNSTLDA